MTKRDKVVMINAAVLAVLVIATAILQAATNADQNRPVFWPVTIGVILLSLFSVVFVFIRRVRKSMYEKRLKPDFFRAYQSVKDALASSELPAAYQREALSDILELLLSAQASGKSVVFDDAAIEAIQKVVDLHLVDNVAPLNDGTQDNGFSSSLGAGNVAMCTEGQWATGFRGAGFEGIDYGVAVLPYMKEKVDIATAGAVGVFATTKYPAEATEFLRWYASEENGMNTIMAGWWMPTRMNWYTDATLLKSWVDDCPLRTALPAEAYKTDVVDVALDTNVTHQTAWYYTPNTYEVLTRTLAPALVEAINGTKTVKEVIESIREAMTTALG